MTKGIGSLGFAAPELFGSANNTDKTKYDSRVDIFSAGSTVFKLANLKVPFPGDTFAILGMLFRKEKADYEDFCPAEMRIVIDECMEFDYSKRPSIDLVIDKLEDKFEFQITKHQLVFSKC